MNERLLVSFSGGKTSAYMSWLIQKHWPERETVYVFANTGKEYEETLVFVDRCDRKWGLDVVWLEAEVQPYGTSTGHRIVTFETASRNGEPFEAVISKYGIPNSAFKHCSRELKANVIRSYARSIGWNEYETAIGMRADERHRINREVSLEENWIYPLSDTWSTRKQDVQKWWTQQPFTLELEEYQGNCDLCWKKSDRKLVRLIASEPQRLEWWADMEHRFGKTATTRRRALRIDYATFFRGGRAAEDMKALADTVGLGLFAAERLSDLEQQCFCKDT